MDSESFSTKSSVVGRSQYFWERLLLIPTIAYLRLLWHDKLRKKVCPRESKWSFSNTLFSGNAIGDNIWSCKHQIRGRSFGNPQIGLGRRKLPFWHTCSWRRDCGSCSTSRSRGPSRMDSWAACTSSLAALWMLHQRPLWPSPSNLKAGPWMQMYLLVGRRDSLTADCPLLWTCPRLLEGPLRQPRFCPPVGGWNYPLVRLFCVKATSQQLLLSSWRLIFLPRCGRTPSLQLVSPVM